MSEQPIQLGGPRYALVLEYLDGARIDEPGPVRVGTDTAAGTLHIVRFTASDDQPQDATFVPLAHVRAWTLTDYPDRAEG